MTSVILPASDSLKQRASQGLERARTMDPGGQAALLLLTLGPVQRFIAAARRTSDLRAGSFLLSSLAARALRIVVDRVSKDAVFFPDLDSEPELLASWETGSPLPPDLALPNRFLAVVPEQEADRIARSCEQAAREALEEAVRFARNKFESFHNAWGWHEAEHFLECAWAVLPFVPGDDYGTAYRTLEQAVGGTKALRTFDAVESTGFRDSLVPSLGALVPDQNAPQHKVDTFWKRHQERGRLRLRAGEQLSAVSLTKRLFAEYVGRHAQDLFPSTASLAVADFKSAVLQKLGEDPDLRDALERLQLAISPLEVRPEVHSQKEPALPLLTELAQASGVGSLATWFASLTGDWLFDDFLTSTSFQATFDLVVSDRELIPAREALRAFLRITDVARIGRPSRYYALIKLDGDQMGQWLSGEKTDGISPERHLAISEALGTFSRNLVPYLVEKQYLGRLVYSGGDDVLAFVSFDDALPLLYALRAAFSGNVRFDEETGYVVDWTRKSGDVTVDGEILRTLGPAATASAGLVLAHQQEPLQDVLADARSAEKTAKDRGRDRFALRLGHRSGMRFTAIAPWRTGEGTDLLPLITRLSHVIRSGQLSVSFVYDAREAADVLKKLPGQAIELDLRRLFGRRTEQVVPINGETHEDAIQRLWNDTIAPLLRATASLDETVDLIHAALIFGKGGDRER